MGQGRHTVGQEGTTSHWQVTSAPLPAHSRVVYCQTGTEPVSSIQVMALLQRLKSLGAVILTMQCYQPADSDFHCPFALTLRWTAQPYPIETLQTLLTDGV